MKKTIISTMIRWSWLVLLVGVIGTGCRKQDYFYKEFLEGGEIVYVGKADSVKFHPGDNRAKLSWIITDPNINKMKVYWNNRLDSTLIYVNNWSVIDSIDVVISELEERLYFFDIYTVE